MINGGGSCSIPSRPIAPTLVRPPFHREGWVYEEKVDGWRMLACKDGARVSPHQP